MTRTMLMVDARDFALRVHGEQKYGARPYGVHLKAVAQKVRDLGGSDAQVAAGWLHDTLEDTLQMLTLSERRRLLEQKFGTFIEGMVWACTGTAHGREEAFDEQMAKLAKNPEAMLVKIADRFCNMDAVADDLEFETDYNNLKRLRRIGSFYLAEFKRFINVATTTIPNLKSGYDMDLLAARDRVHEQMDRTEGAY